MYSTVLVGVAGDAVVLKWADIVGGGAVEVNRSGPVFLMRLFETTIVPTGSAFHPGSFSDEIVECFVRRTS